METITNILFGITSIISVAAIIAAATPSTTDDEFLGKIMKYVNVIALNIGNAVNEKAKKKVKK
tara:strand:+ start:284 stop:472 length:189 start_codon:yes stop_codon:yes gene_type:complete